MGKTFTYEGETYTGVSELDDGECKGCVFDRGVHCPQKSTFNCIGRIVIRDTPEAAEEYMLLKTKLRLGLEVDDD